MQGLGMIGMKLQRPHIMLFGFREISCAVKSRALGNQPIDVRSRGRITGRPGCVGSLLTAHGPWNRWQSPLSAANR